MNIHGNKGKKRTPEQRIKMGNSHKGQKPWNKGMTGEKSHLFGIKRDARQRELARKNNSGPNNHFWKGGISPINERIRKTAEYKLWREAVFRRDDFECIWGGKEHGHILHADHIKPFALFPELRFAIDNGRTLCEDCHKKTDTYGGKTRGFKLAPLREINIR